MFKQALAICRKYAVSVIVPTIAFGSIAWDYNRTQRWKQAQIEFDTAQNLAKN